ncbi:hypothetical protein A2U94_11860 [Bacillus sp. VT 712]|uniref:DUF4083 domain-containing protein n=1 Tax=Priestia veravalensis TaxID=1414648 RepID=A0A0V8JR14_9BACI|nr:MULTISPECIES: DUF4083 family protein [Bacillaceae]USY57018.1 DUF4083 family protein [Bacillus sp. 1780r2a1]KSU89479.1 hypothetical protein AS180_02735 [Priestia veravalensis]KZB91235.1 hypothetical protein A2U94_11860 [Bacillus sp. VT 712]MDT2046840.1 DUF4083 family protein [Priestia flexa]MEC0668131.1 DUF4083 family protein [Priestia flexa]
MSTYNIGDIIFQLVTFGLIILFIALLVFLFRSFLKSRKQLNQIEQQVKELTEKLNKDKH